jgi:hypothetical protein
VPNIRLRIVTINQKKERKKEREKERQKPEGTVISG